MKKKIGIFGGTFNPPHKGHEKLARHFFSFLELDEMLIIPTAVPPHKQAKKLASGEDRLAMCALAFPEFQVNDIEIKRGGRSYTIETLEHIKVACPDSDLFFIIGSDMLMSFDVWYRYEDILGLCTICAAARDAENDPIKAKGVPPIFSGHRLIVSDTEPFDISSGEIRQMIANGEDIGKFVSPGVCSYIAERGLYRD